jgi:hypothetical protein
MEQLAGDTIERLLAQARSGGLAPDGAAPPGRQHSPELWARAAPALRAVPAPALGRSVSSGAPVSPIGIERRLVRRAEAHWARLADDRPDAALPPAALAAELLAPPFAPQALLVQMPAPPFDPATAGPRIAFAGEGLEALHLRVPGGSAPDRHPHAAADAALGTRLLDLAARAARERQPAHFDSESEPRPAGLRPSLLVRAVALPFAPPPGGGASVVVVASWRQLLSSQETAALHRELAAAIDWMQQLRP